MPFDEELPAFIRRHFPSVWTLEILLLLQADPQRCWREEEIVSELRASHALVTRNLDALQLSGLVSRNDAGASFYSPADGVIASLTEELRRAYRQRPVSIISLIAAPDDRLRQLADAFRFKPPAR